MTHQLVMSEPDFIRSLFTADCVVIVERDSTIAWCNGVAADLLGIERGAAARQDIAARCGLSMSEFGGRPLALSEIPIERVWSGKTIDDLEICLRSARTGDEPVWFSVDIEPVYDGDEDRVSAAMVIAHEITSRKRALRGLEDSNAALTALVQASPLPILAVDLDGNITYWNRAAESVFGWRAAEVIGRPVPFIPEEKVAEHEQLRLGHLTGAMLVNREIRRQRKDGEPIDLSVSTAPIRDKAGIVNGTICVYIDISERKRMEEELWQSSRMESLAILAGGVAHDFNNLLTSILGNASLAILDARPESDQELALRNVIDACGRAVVLTDQMLAYSGKGRFHLQRIDLSALVREMRPLIESSLGSRITVSFDLRESLPVVHGDPQQLQQVILNVVTNAGESIHSCGEVSIKTSLDTSGRCLPGPCVCFEIIDNGCGMDADTKARMFDPFFSTKFTGRGLGLAAVIGITRGHKGAVEVTSAPEQGTHFRVLLPVGEQ